jgi:hypothetical protein
MRASRKAKKESREKMNAYLKASRVAAASIRSTGGENSVAESVADSSPSVESEEEKQKSDTPEASTVSWFNCKVGDLVTNTPKTSGGRPKEASKEVWRVTAVTDTAVSATSVLHVRLYYITPYLTALLHLNSFD